MTQPDSIHLISAAIFFLAVLHTFLTKHFQHLAHAYPRHAGIWHLLGEVEVVFGFWALLLMLALVALSSPVEAIGYFDSLNFTEPLFVFVILVMAATRPVLHLAQRLVNLVVRLLPLYEPLACYLVTLTLVPLLGSLITEPAAMTLAALMLRDRFYRRGISPNLKYGTLAVLLVNVSIGGVLTPFAAPPVLMVASSWGWDIGFMLTQFGWKAVLAVGLNAVLATLLFARELMRLPQPDEAAKPEARMPPAVVA
ncbi:MAG: putative Na+/H+ antiporter, partial [Burkholderiaceae bacterium]|nr:putative Na+/H+ antiporter [Burkholderiaceae bacterium]